MFTAKMYCVHVPNTYLFCNKIDCDVMHVSLQVPRKISLAVTDSLQPTLVFPSTLLRSSSWNIQTVVSSIGESLIHVHSTTTKTGHS